MDKSEKVKFWIQSAEDDWQVANHLMEKRDYPYALFLGQLSVEKLLKAIYAGRLDENPPYTHRLVYLADKIQLGLTDEQMDDLETITDFNIEARYPDEKFSFKKKCTQEFAEKYHKKIERMRKWLLRQIP